MIDIIQMNLNFLFDFYTLNNFIRMDQHARTPYKLYDTTDRILRVSNIMIYSGTNIYITLSIIIAIEYDNFIVEDKATRFICHCITLKFEMIRLCCVFFGHSIYLCARVYFV